jgi:hypothetical protein
LLQTQLTSAVIAPTFNKFAATASKICCAVTSVRRGAEAAKKVPATPVIAAVTVMSIRNFIARVSFMNRQAKWLQLDTVKLRAPFSANAAVRERQRSLTAWSLLAIVATAAGGAFALYCLGRRRCPCGAVPNSAASELAKCVVCAFFSALD